MGVAAEIEITQLLTSASRTPPTSPKKTEFRLKSGDWDNFKKKLQEWPQDVGLQAAASFSAPGMFPISIKVVKELYLCGTASRMVEQLNLPRVSGTSTNIFLRRTRCLNIAVTNGRALESSSTPTHANAGRTINFSLSLKAPSSPKGSQAKTP